MICGGCGNENAFRFFKSRNFECCDRCSNLNAFGTPDVYWDGKEEHGLPDDPKTGKPMVFGSKFEKARYLKEHNLVESGDRIRGGHATIFRDTPKQDDSMEAVNKALAFVKQMGSDRRREEFRKILKSGGNNDGR